MSLSPQKFWKQTPRHFYCYSRKEPVQAYLFTGEEPILFLFDLFFGGPSSIFFRDLRKAFSNKYGGSQIITAHDLTPLL